MEQTSLKQTPLYQKHIDLGAKLVPFAGFEMPVQYSGLTEEHHAVRRKAGVFDVSHMGEFFIEGPQALDLIQWISSNDAAKLLDGKVQYSCMPNGKGGIVDDLLIYRLSHEKYMLVVNASNIEKDRAWIESQNRFDARLTDRSEEYALLAVQGPVAATALQSLTELDLNAIEFYTFETGVFAGVENVIVSATGYTGAGGFELYVDAAKAADVWDAVMKAGEAFGLLPAGLGARDTLRLEMGFCLYGNDITDSTSPIEAGLGWITKFTKDFVDRKRLEEQKENGTARRLVGLEMLERGIPRQGYAIEDASGNVIGEVTSGTMSPSADKAIGMGYVQSGFRKAESEVYIRIRKKALKAKVVRPPFYTP